LVECIVAYRVLVTRCLCQFTCLLKHEALGGKGLTSLGITVSI